MLKKLLNGNDPFKDCQNTKDLWDKVDQVQQAFNGSRLYLLGVQAMAKIARETQEYRIGGEVLEDKKVVDRYMSRNNPQSGKIISIDDLSGENGFPESPHMVFAMQHSDVMNLLHQKKLIQRMLYLPLIPYLDKIQPVNGYGTPLEQAKSIGRSLIFGKR
jgi:hypothetical protein